MVVNRRDVLAAASLPLLMPEGLAQSPTPSPSAPSRNVLRAAALTAEVGFDPVQIADGPSLTIIDLIFESPLTYDALSQRALLKPQTAASMPEVSDNFRRFVFTIKPGILFADDPVFKGQPRELVAADYVYSIKRYYDPAVKTERLYLFENAKLLGLSELRKKVLAARTPFPYDQEVDGLRVLDRYRFEVRLAAPSPRFADIFSSPAYVPGMAREVVEAYANDLMAHPVGTGPYRLVQWRRSSKTVLERNPRYREVKFDSTAPDDADEHVRAAARELAGRRLPLIDRIEVNVMEESQPRWLAFLQGEIDTLRLPPSFAPQAVPGGKLAPYLAKRGVWARNTLTASITHTFFNFDDPQVGGYTPERIALRRAIALGYDDANDIRLLYNGLAVPAQSMIAPHNEGFDSRLKTESGDHDPARANALLDVFGYQKGADGWRRHPNGQALTLRRASPQDQRSRQLNELWRKYMSALGLRIEFETAPFGELIKRALAGQLQMWGFIWQQGPDGEFFLGLAYGPNAEQSNDARFKLPEYDRLFERIQVMENSPERLALMRQAQLMMLAYMPYIPHVHPIDTDLSHAHVRHLIRHPFKSSWWAFTQLV